MLDAHVQARGLHQQTAEFLDVFSDIPSSKNGSSDRSSSHSRKDKPHKTTRVRTVLNEKQLHTLRTCYAANPRPDALMKEQLVEMTNLSPRVIRVSSDPCYSKTQHHVEFCREFIISKLSFFSYM